MPIRPYTMMFDVAALWFSALSGSLFASVRVDLPHLRLEPVADFDFTCHIRRP
jgi:hypothetical protein